MPAPVVKTLADSFCKMNNIPLMKVELVSKLDWSFGACAYWRRGTCNICIAKCARPSGPNRSRNWNWPGSVTDRLPVGVVAHELGHHVDWHCGTKKNSYSSELSTKLMQEAKERPITSYAPNPSEWFAEMFRLFVTNPDLLRLLRPRTHKLFTERWQPVLVCDWKDALAANAPDHIVSNLQKKIDASTSKTQR